MPELEALSNLPSWAVIVLLLGKWGIDAWRSKRDDTPSADVHLAELKTEVAALIKSHDENCGKISSIATQVHELHKWHDVDDGTGRKLWYGNRSDEQLYQEILRTLRGILTQLE